MPTTAFTHAPGRELYQRLGFEVKEKPLRSATEAVVNSVPCKRFQPPFVLLQVAMCLYIAVRAACSLPLHVVLSCVCGTYAMYDLLSGWAHFCLDYEGFNTLPFGLGDLCRTFQHHHLDTTFIYRVNCWTSLSEGAYRHPTHHEMCNHLVCATSAPYTHGVCFAFLSFLGFLFPCCECLVSFACV